MLLSIYGNFSRLNPATMFCRHISGRPLGDDVPYVIGNLVHRYGKMGIDTYVASSGNQIYNVVLSLFVKRLTTVRCGFCLQESRHAHDMCLFVKNKNDVFFVSFPLYILLRHRVCYL